MTWVTAAALLLLIVGMVRKVICYPFLVRCSPPSDSTESTTSIQYAAYAGFWGKPAFVSIPE
jgi:hypothetical protein